MPATIELALLLAGPADRIPQHLSLKLLEKAMKGRTWMLLWPGLAGLWLRGGWANLIVAAAFAAAFNFALVTTFVWPQILSREVPPWGAPAAAWVLVLWFWVMGRRSAVRLLSLEAAKSLQPDEISDALLADAQREYLKGHWLEA